MSDVSGGDQIVGRLADLGRDEVDLVPAPGALWERVARAVSADAKRGPRRSDEVGMTVEYVIDAQDHLGGVGEGWSDFAAENEAPELADRSDGPSLWSCIGDDETAAVWHTIVDRVRAENHEVRVPLRCDAADARRWFEVTVSPIGGGALRFRAELVREEDRLAVALLDPDAVRDPSRPTIVVCSWCGHANAGDGWYEIGRLAHDVGLVDGETMPPIAYGICPTCRDTMTV